MRVIKRNILVNSETSLQQYIDNQTNGRYKSAVVGKWHLSGNTANFNPLTFGLDYYAGILGGSVQNNFQWDLTTNGSTSSRSGYTSKVFTDLAIDWVEAQSSPWFLWLAFNAPHTPFHRPPAIMHNQGNLPNYSDGMDPMPYYLAAIEAMDFQIGRFLNGLSQQERDNTVIIFMGDNGTPNQAGQSPYANNAVKGTSLTRNASVPMGLHLDAKYRDSSHIFPRVSPCPTRLPSRAPTKTILASGGCDRDRAPVQDRPTRTHH